MSEAPFLPRSADQNHPAVTPAGFGSRTPDGGYAIDPGTLEGLNWSWNPTTKILSAQLVAGGLGAVAPATPITSGLQTEDGRDVSGTLDEILTIVRRAPEAQQGTVTVRVVDPKTGVAVLRGDLLVHTSEGLGNLAGVLTSGGLPRTEFDREAQDGAVPAGVRTEARMAWWPGLPGTGLAAPLRYSQYAKVGSYREGEDVTARSGSADPMHVWCVIAPYDEELRGDVLLDFGKDPDGYQDRVRWAPLATIDRVKVIGDDKPPPPPPRKPGEPEPPPIPIPPFPPFPPLPPGGGKPDPKNPQERNVATPEAALPSGFVGIALPEPSTPIGVNSEAFTTETGNATSPHPVTISIAQEDDEDADNGGIPTPDGGADGVPLTADCPLEGFTPNPELEEWLEGFGSDDPPAPDAPPFPFFPLPDPGIGVLFL